MNWHLLNVEGQMRKENEEKPKSPDSGLGLAMEKSQMKQKWV